MRLHDDPKTGSARQESADRRARPWNTMMVVMGVGIVTVAAFSAAWVTEDAFISFRYVDNLWAGNGLVFNVGERVQGFTHPLWLFLLAAVPGRFTFYYSMALGLVCTTAAALLVGLAWRHRFGHTTGFVLVCIVLASSDSFRSFSTGGLENALTHFLLAWLVCVALEMRSPRLNCWGVGLSTCLIILNRMDQVFLVAPILLWCLLDPSSGTPRGARVRAFAVTAIPLLLWWVFAALYFGYPLPNTFYAKLAPTDPGIAWRQGLVYCADYALHEPLHACVLFVGLILPWLKTNLTPFVGGAIRALGLGLCLQLAYVVASGGDYMRGRFLVSSLFLATVLVMYLVDTHRGLLAHNLAVAVSAVVFGVFGLLVSEDGQLPCTEAADRHVYNEHRLRHVLWLANQTPNAAVSPPRPAIGNALRRYAAVYGPILLRWDSAGEVPYWAGQQVDFIDGLGIIDPFVARCRPTDLYRIGHISHDIPESYFRARKCIHLLADWEERLKALDPALKQQAEAAALDVVWSDPTAELRFHELQALTRGPVFSASRLKLVLKYTFTVPKAYTRVARDVIVGDIRIAASFEPGFGDLRNILQKKPDGFAWNDPSYGVELRSNGQITVDFGRQIKIAGIELQGDWNDFYRLSFSRDGRQFGEPILFLEAAEPGMRTRTADPGLSRTARYVRIDGLEGDNMFSIGYLGVRE